MSDSDSSQEIEVKDEQQHEAKVRELIEKGTKILPDYSQDSLFNIYKQAFYTETVFLNKLNMIAKQNAINEQNDSEWIFEKKHEKSTAPKRQSIQQNKPKRQKYNFLEDTKLIERALKYRREDAQRKEYPPKIQQFIQKAGDNEELPPKQKQQYKEKVNQTYREKKTLYKEKQPVSLPIKNDTSSKPSIQPIKSAPQPIKHTHQPIKHTPQPIKDVPIKPSPEPTQKKETKQVKGYVEKKVKYTEKKEQKSEITKQTVKQQVVQPTKVTVEQKKIENIPKNEIKSQIKSNNQSQKHNLNAKVYTSKVEPVIQQEKKQANGVKPITQEVKSQSSQKISSQKDVNTDPQVEKQFNNSLKQNSFVLSFIKPTNKLQKISYIRYPDGKMTEIKVKQPLALDKRN